MKKLFTCFFAIGSLYASAQVVTPDVYLRGHYVEVGTGHLGYYGSNTIAPTGYHPHLPGSSNLGFVADPGMTGWSTSPSSHYAGDYFVPGYPFEGWELQEGGTLRIQGFNSGSTTSSFNTVGGTGAVVTESYSTSGSKVIGTWEGTFDSIDINQVTTLDTNDLFFTVKVTFTNLSVSPKNDLYYVRAVDPDNDETWTGGSFATDNMVNYQSPLSGGVSAVTATGISSAHPTVTYGSADTASRAFIFTNWSISLTQDLAAFYAENTSAGGTSYYDTGVNHMGDIAIGIIRYIPHLATVDSAADSVLRTTSTSTLHPANTATFTYFVAFRPDAVDSAIARVTGSSTVVPTAISNVNNTPSVRVYPNPAHDNITVSGLKATDHFSVFDIVGHQVIADETSNGTSQVLSLRGIPAGSYMLIVTDEKGNVNNRIPVRKM